jgi:hypothetical protein
MTFEDLKQKIVAVVSPYHTINGNDENGCPYLCSSCRDRRRIRDKVKQLFEEYENPASLDS